MRGADLPTQVHVAYKEEPLSAEAFRPPTEKHGGYGWVKPRGGFWTSTATPDAEAPCSWLDWCIAEEFCKNSIKGYWQITPDPAAKVFRIDNYADLACLVGRYPYPVKADSPMAPLSDGREFPDWSAVAADYDAVYLTENGQSRTRMSHPLNLYGWDCESTLWLRWAINDVTALPIPEMPESLVSDAEEIPF